jgi:DNA-directed RNA polymerase subunit K/omega
MDFKKTNAAKDTITRNMVEIAAPTNNVYESISIISKRAIQIGEDIKQELHEKLEEFNVHTDTLEEIFENKEQIELSRIYEALPKAHSMALQEWMEERIHYRKPEVEQGAIEPKE